MAVSLQNATRLALWLAREHPAAFRQIAWQMQTARERAQSGGLGAFGYAGRQVYVDYGRPRSGHYRANGGLGDGLFVDIPEPSLQDITVDVNAIEPITDVSAYTAFDWSTLDFGSGSAAPGVSDVSYTAPNFDPVATAASGDSSGFWGSIGSAFSSAGSVIASVARNLTNPQVLSAAGNIAATVIKADAQNQAINAQQQAVLQTQLARVQQGQSPAAIQYVKNAAGQSVPLYYNAATGQYVPASTPTLSSLMPSGTPTWLPWVLGGGLVLTVLLSSRSVST